MKKLSLILSLVLVFFAASTKAGGQVGNATESKPGAGVYKNGIYMTFGSAGVWTEPVVGSRATIPGLKELVEIILKDEIFSLNDKAYLKALLNPSGDRFYYRVMDEKFDSKTRSRLIEEYRRVTNIKSNNLGLFAVTDAEKRTTYLLPAFYKLKTIEQQAVLFHEAYWLLRPSSTYEEVIFVETNFQKYLENPKDYDALFNVVSYLGIDGMSLARATLTMDKNLGLDSNAQLVKDAKGDGYAQQEKIKLNEEIFNKEYDDCLGTAQPVNVCYVSILKGFLNKQENGNKSYFLKFLIELFQNYSFNAEIDWSGSGRFDRLMPIYLDKTEDGIQFCRLTRMDIKVWQSCLNFKFN